MTQPEPNRPRQSPAALGVTAARAVIAAQRPKPPAVYGYAFAVLATAVALGLTVLLHDYLSRTIFILFWPVIFATAALAGVGPAVLASILAVLSVDYFVIPPLHTLRLTEPADLLSSLIFVIASVVISTLADERRKAELVAGAAAAHNAELAQQLEEQAVELESQLEEAQTMSLELEQTGAELEEEREAAEKAAAFTRGIIASITDPFIVQDADWRFTYINGAAGASFHRSGHASDPTGDSLIGTVVWDAYPDIRGSVFEREMKRSARDRVPVSFDGFYPETGRWTQLNCYPLADGGLAIQWKDITVRRKAEEAASYLDRATELLTSPLDPNKRLRDLAALVVPEFADWCAVEMLDDAGELHQVAVAHIDPEKVKFASELNRKYPPRTDSPYGVPNVLRTGKPELIADITDEMLVEGAIDEAHLRITRELGLRSAIVVPLTVRGKTIGALTMVSAESRRRYTEEDVALALELARRAAYSVDNAQQHQAAVDAQHLAEGANRAKSQFLAAMSHELRTPLNAIAGYIDLMLLGIRGAITDEQKLDLERIRIAQRHLLGLINDVLDFSRLEAGRVMINTSRVEIAPVVNEVVTMLGPEARERSVRLDYQAPTDGLSASGDVDRIRQIIINLLSNALKFTEADGSIQIRCEADRDRVLIHVSDTGMGIDVADQERIFFPFVQANRSFNSPMGGVGLGLAISRELARAMKGELTVESTVGVGSTFTLELPHAEA